MSRSDSCMTVDSRIAHIRSVLGGRPVWLFQMVFVVPLSCPTACKGHGLPAVLVSRNVRPKTKASLQAPWETRARKMQPLPGLWSTSICP